MRVSISNRTNDAVELHRVVPGVVIVEGKHFDINAELLKRPVNVTANSVQYLWLSPVVHTDTVSDQGEYFTRSETIDVRVIRGQSSVMETQRVYFGTV